MKGFSNTIKRGLLGILFSVLPLTAIAEEELCAPFRNGSVDESIVAIREKVGQMKAEAKIAGEMRSSTVGAQDETYERIGAEKAAANRFDELLKARSAAKQGVPEKERDLG